MPVNSFLSLSMKVIFPTKKRRKKQTCFILVDILFNTSSVFFSSRQIHFPCSWCLNLMHMHIFHSLVKERCHLHVIGNAYISVVFVNSFSTNSSMAADITFGSWYV